MVSRSLPAAKPRGSKSGTGARVPGRPYANSFSLGTHPFMELREVEERPVVAGEKAAAEAASVAAIASFMVVDECLVLLRWRM